MELCVTWNQAFLYLFYFQTSTYNSLFFTTCTCSIIPTSYYQPSSSC